MIDCIQKKTAGSGTAGRPLGLRGAESSAIGHLLRMTYYLIHFSQSNLISPLLPEDRGRYGRA